MKGELVQGKCTIKKTWTACVGCMAWESPHILIVMEDGREFLWRPEFETWLYKTGKSFVIRAFAYDSKCSWKTLRRVKMVEVA